ncbi:MAG: rod shape-determining protein MreC [Acidobacteria bacterium]|nr:rod shape-determining protein MreC [Acidobacteriota bacterium]
MENFLSRYRNLSVLLLLVVAQLLLLAYQVKARDDVPLIRVWAVTAVTPLARGIEGLRSGTGGFLQGYVFLKDVQSENQRLKHELGDLRLRNRFLASELASADRAKALAEFRSRTPSKLLAARVIGTGTGANSRVVFVDRGTTDGVKKGMATIAPDGIVGKVVAAYPTASLVQLITEQGSAAGVVSQKHQVRGTLKGVGLNTCIVEYVQNEDKLEPGEWFYTSGADRVFPRGMPVGQVKMVREGRGGKEVVVAPSGVQAGLEEMLIVLDGVHQLLPAPETPAATDVNILAAPPAESQQPASSESGEGAAVTDADRLKDRYQRVVSGQGVQLGVKGAIADFNRAPAPVQVQSAQPPAGGSPRPPESPKPADPAKKNGEATKQ